MAKKKIEDCMTSELLFHALKTPDKDESNAFMEAYNRRQALLELTPLQKSDMYLHDEQAVLDGSCYIDIDTLLASAPDGNLSSALIVYPTLSELVKHANTAVSISIDVDMWLTSKPWDTICENALYHSSCMAARILRNVLNFNIGLAPKQISAYISQEFNILRRLYYHFPDKSAA